MVSVAKEIIDVSTLDNAEPRALEVIRVQNFSDEDEPTSLNFARIIGFEVGERQLDRDEPFIAVHFQVDNPEQLMTYVAAIQRMMRRKKARGKYPSEAPQLSGGTSGYPNAPQSQETP